MNTTAHMKSGYQSPAKSLARNLSEQTAKLACCGVDGRAHGNNWAPGLLGTDCFIHMGHVGLEIAGTVHTDMRLIQTKPLPLNETLSVTTETTSIEAAPRGTIARMRFDFAGSISGNTVACHLGLLTIDPQKTPPDRPRPPAIDPREGFERINERRISPDDVVTYGGAGNPIHHDPVFAQSVGYRAPIAHGVMTAIWMLAALDERDDRDEPSAPAALDVTFSFRRPVFWDDAMELWRGAETTERTKPYRTLNADGKITAEMQVYS